MRNDFIYHLKNKPIRLNRVGLVKGVDVENYDYFSDSLSPEIERLIDAYYANENDVDVMTIADLNNQKTLSFNKMDTKKMPVFVFCKVVSDLKTKIVLQHGGSVYTKIWVNSTLYSAYQDWSGYGHVFTVNIEQGENIFVFEYFALSGYESLGVRLSRYQYEMQDHDRSLLNRNLFFTKENAYISCNKIEICDETQYKCLLMAENSNDIDINQDVIVKIIKRFTWEIIQEGSCNFFKEYTVDRSEYCNGNDNTDLDELIFQFEYTNKNGQKCYLWSEIYLCSIKDKVCELRKEAEVILLTDLVNNDDKLAIRSFYNIYSTINPNSVLELSEYSLGLGIALQKIYDGTRNDDTVYQAGFRRKYFKSALDDSVEYYNISIPEGYDKKQKYPLLIIMSLHRHENDSSVWGNYSRKPIIAVDISARGVNLGSYVGEAAITEALDDVLKCFNIDEDRIYITGLSNGAGATWAYAKIYPYKFAGIFPFSGPVSTDGVENLHNVKIINTSSTFEHLYNWAYKAPLRKLLKTSDFKGILTKKMVHPDLSQMRFKECYLDAMLEVKKYDYPDKIYYYTERNRHCRSYWIEIISIAFKKKYARITVEIINGDIFINAQNVTGLVITIPPQIDRKCFNVSINRANRCKFVDYDKDEIYFVKKSNIYILVDEKPPKVLSRKGMGLLDVYLGPMRIIADTTMKDIADVADAFSHPSSNGFDPVVYVDYPIYETSEIKSLMMAKNLIIIDNHSESDYLIEIRKHMKIVTTKDGYEYLGVKQKGSYCCMQVVANPYDTQKSILYINCNDVRLFKKNLFTRKVVIPSYANGIHPFWNNEALVYSNNKLYGVYEWGMQLEEIK
jgi:hypothetical protein